MSIPFHHQKNARLGPLTTLEIGGPAELLVRCRTTEELAIVVAWCRSEHRQLTILGGGSNVVIADCGLRGVVAQLAFEHIDIERDGKSSARLVCGAGVAWDRLVETAVGNGLGGLECLSGIPGLVGAAPIQNIGAYGQEIATVVERVELVDLRAGGSQWRDAGECGFAYRWSRFKGEWAGRYAVAAVELRLPISDRGLVAYPDLERSFSTHSSLPSLADVRRAVLDIRASKSMVIHPEDPNRRSAGSFFVNPVVDVGTLERVRALADPDQLPAYPQSDDRFKLSAAWLIERAGFRRGHQRGNVGLSTNHALALVNRGGATAIELLAFAGEIRRRVRDETGISLCPEPVFLGFEGTADDLLG